MAAQARVFSVAVSTISVGYATPQRVPSWRMALTPGGGRSPSAQPPPKPVPPAPPRGPRDSRLVPRTNWRTALIDTVRWGTLMGGLVIIVDLATQAMQQRSPTPESINDLAIANQVLNVVMFSVLGAIVARQTGLFVLSALAAVIAAVIDGIVVAAAASLAPTPGGTLPFGEYMLLNLTLSTIPATVSGFVATLVERMAGPRGR